ncbi:phytoene/squalene synthase family protein [Thalassococcus sp. BH17M4-6]|uniref:phytoene/squalene synthase family protein n=1 Tax=Thalassococcus sp. BH17M4-6 TaxID=3413148 RepID=UPI003BEA8A83
MTTAPDFDADVTACAQIVERGDPDRFASVMAGPVWARARLFPIYAFNIEVARAPWVTQEPMIAEMRLQWWRDALEEIRTGGPVRRHEVVTPLARVLDADGATLLDRLVQARRWDVYRDAFEDEAHFAVYLEQTAGHLMLAAARALTSVEAQPLLDLGYAQGLATFLQAVPELEAKGRVPMVDGRPEAVAVLAQDALMRLDRGQQVGVPKAARPAVLAAWAARPLLRQVVRDPACVKDGRLGLSEVGKRLRLLRVTALGRV